MTGSTIAHYSILEKLGEGGMGVVYRARDTKLDRDVALKFLPAHLAASDQDKARFVQEAKAAAALNHPNVCSIIDIQEHETAVAGAPGTMRQMFIVMEFVDGMTLRQKMESVTGGTQPYPVKQAIDLGIQVADGLAAAHEKGIVHRDVKPENIMVRKDGIAQVMDFGLAKLRGTVSRITKAGSTVGTAGYMSPEQVQGLDADHRSDIFSLGALLYELFTGRLPFKGVHETALMYEIVNVEPEPMSAVNPGLDPELDRIVYECLQKDPEERYQSVKEVARDLKRVRRESSRARMSRTFPAQPALRQSGAAAPRSSGTMAVTDSAEPPGPAGPPEARVPRRGAGWLKWAALALVAALGIVTVLLRPWETKDRAARPVTRLNIRFPEDVLIPIGGAGVGISPDGKFISLVVQQGLETKMFLRPSDRETLEPVLGSGIPSGQPYYHAFAPDGQWIAFFPGNGLKKASVFGGAPVHVCDLAGQPRGLWWGSDGNIYIGHISNAIHRVSANGGTPEPVTVLDSAAGEISHRFPALLPDGKSILYTIKFNNITTFEEAAIAVYDTKSREKKVLVRGGSYARYVPTGHLVYAKGNFLYAVRFDLEKLEVSGSPRKLFKGGWMNPFSGDANISFTDDGTLLYVPRGIESYTVSRIKWIDMQGRLTSLVDSMNSYWTAQLSPDGEKIALHFQGANDDIWIYHLGRKSLTRLTFGGGNSGFPVWSADGKSVYYAAERGMKSDIYRKAWDGSGAEERLTSNGKAAYPRSVSPDGNVLAFSQEGDLWTLDIAGRKVSAFLKTKETEFNPAFSPDGKYIAYESNESGRYEVYITAWPSKAGKWQVSSGGGTNPIWAPSGKALYYAQGTSVHAVDIRPGPGFDFSAPRKVLDLPSDGAAIVDISRDGTRLAMITIPYKELNTSEVTIVTNWFTELENAFAGNEQR